MGARQKTIRSNRNRSEKEIAKLLLGIMANVSIELVSFCLNILF